VSKVTQRRFGCRFWFAVLYLFVSVRGYTTAVVQNRLGIVKRFSLGSDKNCKYYNGGTTLVLHFLRQPFPLTKLRDHAGGTVLSKEDNKTK
jgi:hypothetical protein